MDLRAKKVAAVLALGTLMVMLDVTVTVVAIPRLAESFDTDLATVQWVTTAYALSLVAVMPTAAWAIRRFGAKYVYLTALTLFIGGSALAGTAWNIESLIVFRAVQGLGGGYLQPVGMTIALQMVDERHRGTLMGWLGLPLLIGPVLGPTAGGLLVDGIGWRSLFLINVPIGIAAILLAARLFPHQGATDRDRLDWIALATLAPGGALLVFGLAQAGEHGDPTSTRVLIPMVCGIGLLGLFVTRTLRSSRPLLDLRLLKERSLAVGWVSMFLVAGAYFGSMMLGPIYIQAVRGDSATTAGVIVIGQAITTGLVVQVASRLTDRIDPRKVVWFGISTTVVAMILMTTLLDENTSYPTLVGIGIVMGMGIGATLMPLMTTALRGIAGPAISSGTTILTTGSQFAAAVGAALSATVLTSLFNNRTDVLDNTGMAGALRLTSDEQVTAAPDLASAVADTYLITLGLLILALVISAFLPRSPQSPPQPAAPALAGGTPVPRQELSAEPG